MSITIICILLLLFMDIALFVMLLISGRSAVNKGKTRKFPMYFVFATFTGLLIFSGYNEYMLSKELTNLQILNDSLSLDNGQDIEKLLAQPGGKDQIVDSLRQKIIELENNLTQLKKRESLSKSVSVEPVVEQTRNTLIKVENEISKIESYNEVVDSLSFPKNLSKVFKFSGNTQHFVFYPPKNIQDNYIDFSLKFANDNIISKIAVIYIEIDKVTQDSVHHHISSAFYKPQVGMNNFVLQNFLKEKGTKMMVGFFWKSEFGIVDTPQYEKITFSINP